MQPLWPRLAIPCCIIVQFCAWPHTDQHTHTRRQKLYLCTRTAITIQRFLLLSCAFAWQGNIWMPRCSANCQIELYINLISQHLKPKWNYHYENAAEMRLEARFHTVNWNLCPTLGAFTPALSPYAAGADACRNENVMFLNETFELWCFVVVAVVVPAWRRAPSHSSSAPIGIGH